MNTTHNSETEFLLSSLRITRNRSFGRPIDSLGPGNPNPLVDKNTGRVWLFFSSNDGSHAQNATADFEPIDTWGQRRVYSLLSDDNGETWDYESIVNVQGNLLS